MKNIRKILIVIFAAAIVSCEDATDIVQPGEFAPDAAFQNVADLQTGLFAVYSGLNPNLEINFTSVYTDETSRGEGNGGQGFTNDALATFQLTPNTGLVSALWSSNYTAIIRANTLLAAAERIVPDTSNQAVYDKVIAEALTIRAYCHMTLLAYYAEDLRDPNAVGVIAVDFLPALTEKLPRNTVGEVSALISSDLNRAESLLAPLTLNIADRNFIDINVVRAVRARFSVYIGDYTTAEAMADQLLASFPNTPASQFPALWEDIGTPESLAGVIFKATRTDNSGGAIASIWFTNSTSFAGSAIYEMSRNVYNALAQNPSDVRFNTTAYLDATSIIDPNYRTSPDPLNSDVLVINKYPGKPGIVSLLTSDVKMFRSEEMTFIKIESRINANDLSSAAALMQSLRLQRYPDAQLPTYSSTQQAYADLLRERRLELWLEGHRYMDIRRLGPAANVGFERDATDCIVSRVSNACSLPFTDLRTRYLPIPINELAGNPNITQNTGY